MPRLAYIWRSIERRHAAANYVGRRRRGIRRDPGATISEEDTSRHAHRLELSAASKAWLRMAAETLLGFLLTTYCLVPLPRLLPH